MTEIVIFRGRRSAARGHELGAKQSAGIPAATLAKILAVTRVEIAVIPAAHNPTFGGLKFHKESFVSIVPFTFNAQQVTVVTAEDGEPWFVAKEIAGVLGYTDAEAMTRRLDEDEKQNRQVVGFGPRGVTLISESGLYSAILGSLKPDAKPFKKWVTAEVLPSIRKTGGYTAPNAFAPLKLTTEAARAFPALYRVARLVGCDKNAAAISANQAVLQLSNVNLLQGLGQTHLEAANQDSQFFTPTELGKRIDTSARGVNLLLAEAGMQMKRGDVWEVTDAGREFSRIYDTGKKHGSGVPVTQIKWSPNVLPLLGSDRAAA